MPSDETFSQLKAENLLLRKQLSEERQRLAEASSKIAARSTAVLGYARLLMMRQPQIDAKLLGQVLRKIEEESKSSIEVACSLKPPTGD